MKLPIDPQLRQLSAHPSKGIRCDRARRVSLPPQGSLGFMGGKEKKSRGERVVTI
jgi:hypothetical protein